jgi:gliding motility-associated-like protein
MMKTSYYFRSAGFLGAALSFTSVFAQVELVEGLTPQQYVEQYLLGPGVTVSNVTFNGASGSIANEQIGAFYGSNSVLGLDSGLVLTTGPISIVNGPNNSPSFSEAITNMTYEDQDLEEIANAFTQDAAVLEFDFIPGADSLSFRFVFGSEEYTEWVDSEFNDAFGFFISGPGINGPFSNNAENLAVVPGTNSYVSINTINPWMNSAYYVDNGDGSMPPSSTDPYYIQFDGFTTELIASINVQCGETYHMKMAVADASDPVWDSGVFIVGGTFSSIGSLNMAIGTEIGNGDLMEGCGNAMLTITRSDDSGELVLPLILGGTASAEDVEGLPAEVVMPDGVAQVQITFNAVLDELMDDGELLEISTSFEGPCAGTGGAMASVLITEVPELTVSIAPVPIDCEGTPVDLVAEASGGFGILDLIWQDGTSGDTLTVPGVNSSHSITVTDECGTEATASITLTNICDIEIPNVFTPDGNGLNEYFDIAGIEYTTNVVRIYNRWGNVVFEANNYRNNWNGRDVPDGTYFYEVIVEGHPEPYTGHVTILSKGS